MQGNNFLSVIAEHVFSGYCNTCYLLSVTVFFCGCIFILIVLQILHRPVRVMG